jgi:hypothetical protein
MHPSFQTEEITAKTIIARKKIIIMVAACVEISLVYLIYAGFLAIVSYDSAPNLPPSPPLSRQQLVSLSQSSCVSPVESCGGGMGEELNHTKKSGLYKSFNTL